MRTEPASAATVFATVRTPRAHARAVWQTVKAPQVQAVAGTLAVALMLFGSRWASYLPGFSAPLFATDVLLACAVWQFVVGRRLRPDVLTVQRPVAGRPTVVGLLVVWSTYRFLLSGQFDLIAVRDFVPYFYAVVAVLAWASLREASDAARERTRQVLFIALVGHGLWYFVITLAPDLPLSLPVVDAVQDIHLFSDRTDIDTALAGVLAALMLMRLFRGRSHQVLTLLVFLGSWVSVFSTVSRAGLIAAILANLFAVIAATSERGASRNRSMAMVALAPLLLSLVVVIVPTTSIGTRLSATIGQKAPTNSVAEGAAGTTRARSTAWRAMTGWTTETVPRAVFGAGMGTNIMVESGAAVLLVNSNEASATAPRSPHNYWVGTWARLGLVGVLLAAFAVLGQLRRTWQIRHWVAGDELTLIVVLIPIALLVPTTFGVLLESPFGAVPFWWCVGATLALALPQGRDRPARRASWA